MKNRTENISVRYRPQHLTKSRKKSFYQQMVFFWCGWWDLNPHGSPRHPLKMVRLPFRHNRIERSLCHSIKLVRSRGFEPPRGCPHQLLRLARLPFRHDRASCTGNANMIAYHTYGVNSYRYDFYTIYNTVRGHIKPYGHIHEYLHKGLFLYC